MADIKMPQMDGFELLRAIRALKPDFGGSRDDSLFSARRSRYIFSAGFQACLLKPFTPEKLLETILAVLKSD